MKLSEAIKTLQAEKKRHGDTELFIRVNGKLFPLNDIGVLPGNVLEVYSMDPDTEPKEKKVMDPRLMIGQWYWRFLHRAGDDQGVQYWTTVFVEHGEQVTLSMFLTCPPYEYFNLSGATAEGFITSLYEDLWHRAPGFAAQNLIQQLQVGSMTQQQVAYQVITQP